MSATPARSTASRRREIVRRGSRSRPYRTGAYGAWAMHVRGLPAEAGLEDQPALVDALLAPLAPDVYLHQRESGLTVEQVSDDLAVLARRALGA